MSKPDVYDRSREFEKENRNDHFELMIYDIVNLT
jgi:hypothetical protein